MFLAKTKHFSFFITLLPLIVLIPSFIKSGSIFHKVTSIEPTVVAYYLIAVLLVIRIVTKKPILSPVYQKIYLYLAGIFSLFALIALIILALTFPNFIYSLTYIRVEFLSYLIALSLCIWLTQADSAFIVKNAKKLLLFSPIIVFFIAISMRVLPNNLLFEVTREDSLGEYFQVVALLAGGIAGITIGLKVLKNKQWHGLCLLVAGALLFGVAGEEISWGQRIFHFGNESLQRINYQNETNIHNIYGVHATIPTVYAIIGFLGSVGALIANSLTIVSKNIKKYLLPKKEFFFFFFIPFVYNAAAVNYGPLTESTELILYLGMCFFLLQSITLNNKNS